MADVVPEKYRATAKPLNYLKDNVTDAERQDAEAKAAKTKSLLAPKQSEVAPAPVAAVSSPKPVDAAQRPSCNQKWDEFYSSQDCFAPYSVPTKWGVHFKPEAFSKCQEVKMPVKECGYDKRQPQRQ